MIRNKTDHNGIHGAIAADSVYTETELHYYIDLLRKISMNKYREATTESEMHDSLEAHNIKS